MALLEPAKSALVFGASGVSGWAFVDEMLHDYPQPGIWSTVHALTNRPLQHDDSRWPADPRLHIVSGVDLLRGSQADLEATLQATVPGIERVTHVYYLAYKASQDTQQELHDAVAMLRRSTTALDHLSPALEFVVLQTGAKMYGCHLLEHRPTDYMPVPLHERLPRLRPPHHDRLFYHPQLDWLAAYAQHKPWGWCETRPDIVVGFAPHRNAYSLATALGLFLALFRERHGPGAACAFPGSPRSWHAKAHDSSAAMIARQALHLSLTLPPSAKGEAFNVADARRHETWCAKWPRLCAYFGLEGRPPPAEKGGDAPEVRRYIKDHLAEWTAMEETYGLQRGFADSDLAFPGFEYFLLTQFDFDRQYDMTKMYATGFAEERSTLQAWGGVFDRMKEAKQIPP